MVRFQTALGRTELHAEAPQVLVVGDEGELIGRVAEALRAHGLDVVRWGSPGVEAVVFVRSTAGPADWDVAVNGERTRCRPTAVVLTGPDPEVAAEMLGRGAIEAVGPGELYRLGPALVRAIRQARLEDRLARLEGGPPNDRSLDLRADLLDALPANIALLDPAGRIVAVNRSWCEFATRNGMPAGDPGLGRDYLEICRSVVGPDADSARQIAEGIGSVLRGLAATFERDYACHSPAGERWFRLLVSAMPGGAGAAVMHVDATRRVRAERALRASEQNLVMAVEAAGLGTWDWDLAMGSVTGSAEFLRLFGFGDQKDCDIVAIEQRIHPDDRRDVWRAVREAELHDGVYSHEYRVVTPGGEERWVQARGQFLADGDGALVRMVGVTMDITRTRETDRALREAARRQRDLSRRLIRAQEDERRRIARELHDEVGQSLSVVKAGLQALRNEPGCADRADECMEVVDGSIRQVRDLALHLRPAMLDDLGLVAALGWLVERFAQRTGLDCRLVADPTEVTDVPAEVGTACYRVVQEALTNAARHARARRVRVELAEHAGRLSLVVRDDGIGFDATRARGAPPGDRSLGLLGMHERVELVGGRLEIESAPGQGTEIQASLPLRPAAAPGRPPDREAPR